MVKNEAIRDAKVTNTISIENQTIIKGSIISVICLSGVILNTNVSKIYNSIKTIDIVSMKKLIRSNC